MYKLRYGDKLLYDPRSEAEQLINPVLTQQINVSDELTFQKPLSNEVQIDVLSEEITVWNGDSDQFHGQITNIRDDIQLVDEVTATGELAYLNYSYVPAFDTTTGENAPAIPSAFFNWIIGIHNEQSQFKFVVGINHANELWDGNIFVRSSDTPITSGNAIKERMLDSFGGYIRVRHEDGVRYIDFLSDLPSVTSQAIEFGVNLIDYAKETSTVDLFTGCIAFGAAPEEDEEAEPIDLSTIPDGRINQEYMKASGSCGHYIYNIPAVARYGLRLMTKDYNDLITVDGILNAAMRDTSAVCTEVRTLEISAQDLSVLNPDLEPLSIGYYVPVKAKALGFSAIMAISKVKNAIADPSNSVYTIGTPKATLSRGTMRRIPELSAKMEDAAKATTALTEEQKKQAEQITDVEEKVDGLQNTYVHIRYSPNDDGSDMTELPDENTKYMGIVSDNSADATTDPGAYVWSYIVGTEGEPGEPGTDARIYEIQPSNDTIVAWPDGTYQPSSIVFSSYYRDGNTASRSNYAGRLQIQASVDGATWVNVVTATTNSYTITRALSTIMSEVPGATQVKCNLYAAGGTTTLLGSRTVNIMNNIEELVTQNASGTYFHRIPGKDNYNVGDYLRLAAGLAELGTDGVVGMRLTQSLIELGINDIEAVIKMCDSMFQLFTRIGAGGKPYATLIGDGNLSLGSRADKNSSISMNFYDEYDQPSNAGIGLVRRSDGMIDAYTSVAEWETWCTKSSVNGIEGVLPSEVLFEGSSTGTVTLSDSAANYKLFEIFFNANSLCYSSVKVENPNGKTVSLMAATTDDTYAVFNLRNATISGNTITGQATSNAGRIVLHSTGGTSTTLWGDRSPFVSITKVIGYR